LRDKPFGYWPNSAPEFENDEVSKDDFEKKYSVSLRQHLIELKEEISQLTYVS